MDAIKLRSHVGADGILKLEVPVGVTNTDLDVVVNVEPVGNGTASKTPEDLAIKLRSHVGADGILKLEVPVGVTNTDLDVVVNVEPVGNGTASKTPEEL